MYGKVGVCMGRWVCGMGRWVCVWEGVCVCGKVGVCMGRWVGVWEGGYVYGKGGHVPILQLSD